MLGLIPALGLAARLIQVQDPLVGWVLGSLYIALYLAVLIVARRPTQGAAAGLLLALGVVSLFASLSSLAGVALVLIPATAVILYASARSIRRLKGERVRAAAFVLVGLSASAAVVASSVTVLIVLDSR